MMSEDEARIRELPKLIADEKDNEKMKVLAVELGHLLDRRLNCEPKAAE